MPNENVYNYEDLPLSINMSNTYQVPGIVAPPENSASRNGRLFSLSASASGTVVLGLITINSSIRINNTGTRTFYLSRMVSSIGGSSLLSSVAGAANITSGGTLSSPSAATPANNNFGNAGSSAMTVQTSTTAITGGTQVAVFQLAPGAMQMDFWGGIIVPPGQVLCLNAQASSSSIGLTITSSVSISWWEV